MHRKNIPIVASAASLLLCGGGQMYNRRFWRGAAFVVLQAVVMYQFGVIAYVINLASAIEAGTVALIDQREEESQ